MRISGMKMRILLMDTAAELRVESTHAKRAFSLAGRFYGVRPFRFCHGSILRSFVPALRRDGSSAVIIPSINARFALAI